MAEGGGGGSSATSRNAHGQHPCGCATVPGWRELHARAAQSCRAQGRSGSSPCKALHEEV